MAAHKTLTNQFILVPRGSTLTATVSSTAVNAVRVTAHMAGPGFGAGIQGNHPEAFNQAWSQPLALAGDYSAVVDVDFLGPALATADLRIIDPAGATFLVPWIVQVRGDLGDSTTLSLGIAVI